jgi:LuxR family maltose regulon positive regulatory protein
MLMSLLQTKLYIPASHARPGQPIRVRRLSLTQKLSDGLRRKWTLVCAPAGFGKSTLLAEWIHNFRFENLDFGEGGDAAENPKSKIGGALWDPKFCWLSLDDGDNDPSRFWMYFVAALQTVSSEVGMTTLALLQAPQPLPPEQLLISLLNEVSASTEQLVLVLDDHHVIHTPAIHKALLFLLDHLPPQLHLIISSRADPPWPLARWRSQGQLAELRIEELRFSLHEVTLFFTETMNLDLSESAIAALETRTEGWVAGLQLAALSLQGMVDRERFISQFSGNNRYIVDYLVEEVLSQQTDEVQSFLLQTSILGRLCSSLCRAVLGGDLQDASLVVRDTKPSLANDKGPMTHGDTQAILESLEHANLFLIPLDAERHWYRYHHLFAEVLYNRLRQTQRTDTLVLHRRASAWYEQQQLWSEAIHHALAAEDFAQAAYMIERVGLTHFAQTNIQHSLDRWLSTLPAALIRKRPRLCLIYAWILFAYLDMTTAFQRLAEAEAALQAGSSQLADASVAREIAGEIAAMRAVLTAYTPSLAAVEAVAWGQQAMAVLSSEQLTFRCIAALALGMAYMRQGAVMEAERVLTEANHMSRDAGNAYMLGVAAAHQVAMQRARGLLHLALATGRETLAWVAQHGAFVYPTFGGLYLNLADLLREQNELDAALRYAKEAVSRSDQEINPGLFIISRLVLIRIKQAQGDWPQAWSLLYEVSALTEKHPTVIHSTLLPAITAQFQAAEGASAHNPALAQTNALTLAVAWAQTVVWEEGALASAYRFLDFIYLYEHARIARAQVFISWARATNDRSRLQETLAYLDRQRQVAEDGSLLWFQIKIHLLRALAYDVLQDTVQTLDALACALRLAQPEGYLRIFLDEGEPMRVMILKFRLWIARQPPDEEQRCLSAYLDKLLAAFEMGQESISRSSNQEPPPIQNPKSQIQNLIEPLTERELEVLRLVYGGLSNSEIADRLTVTVGTVKKHINNIFGKLAVASRTQALARAREHNLL